MPRDILAPRIVQYESCRGLEGWTVIAAELDRFWAHRLADPPAAGAQALSSTEAAARLGAARWLMIPLLLRWTRW